MILLGVAHDILLFLGLRGGLESNIGTHMLKLAKEVAEERQCETALNDGKSKVAAQITGLPTMLQAMAPDSKEWSQPWVVVSKAIDSLEQKWKNRRSLKAEIDELRDSFLKQLQFSVETALDSMVAAFCNDAIKAFEGQKVAQQAVSLLQCFQIDFDKIKEIANKATKDKLAAYTRTGASMQTIVKVVAEIGGVEPSEQLLSYDTSKLAKFHVMPDVIKKFSDGVFKQFLDSAKELKVTTKDHTIVIIRKLLSEGASPTVMKSVTQLMESKQLENAENTVLDAFAKMLASVEMVTSYEAPNNAVLQSVKEKAYHESIGSVVHHAGLAKENVGKAASLQDVIPEVEDKITKCLETVAAVADTLKTTLMTALGKVAQSALEYDKLIPDPMEKVDVFMSFFQNSKTSSSKCLDLQAKIEAALGRIDSCLTKTKHNLTDDQAKFKEECSKLVLKFKNCLRTFALLALLKHPNIEAKAGSAMRVEMKNVLESKLGMPDAPNTEPYPLPEKFVSECKKIFEKWPVAEPKKKKAEDNEDNEDKKPAKKQKRSSTKGKKKADDDED